MIEINMILISSAITDNVTIITNFVTSITSFVIGKIMVNNGKTRVEQCFSGCMAQLQVPEQESAQKSCSYEYNNMVFNPKYFTETEVFHIRKCAVYHLLLLQRDLTTEQLFFIFQNMSINHAIRQLISVIVNFCYLYL